MAVPVLNEAPHALGFIVSEAEGPFYTRESVVLAANAAAIFAGSVLAILTASKKYVPFVPGAADGSQNPVGFSMRNHDISAVDRKAAAWVGPGEVRMENIIWPAGISANDKATAVAALNAKGIKFR